MKTKQQQEIRRAAQAKMNTYCDAIDEHLSEAERNDNPLMAEIYREFLKAMRAAQHVRTDGTLTITLDLTEGK